jgi:hypothetical protein
LTDFTFLEVAAENLRKKAEEEERAKREPSALDLIQAQIEAYDRWMAGIKPN